MYGPIREVPVATLVNLVSYSLHLTLKFYVQNYIYILKSVVLGLS